MDWRGAAAASDMSKAHTTIRQFYRDWSAEGARERGSCYDPVLQALENEFPDESIAEVKVLVPGAGLGRLVFELSQAGYAAEGNEISYHQLLASSWVLNHAKKSCCNPLYPFATHFSNLISRSQQLRQVMIPDIAPSTAVAEEAPI